MTLGRMPLLMQVSTDGVDCDSRKDGIIILFEGGCVVLWSEHFESCPLLKHKMVKCQVVSGEAMK